MKPFIWALSWTSMSCKQMLDGLPYTSCGTRSLKMTCFSQNSWLTIAVSMEHLPQCSSLELDWLAQPQISEANCTAEVIWSHFTVPRDRRGTFFSPDTFSILHMEKCWAESASALHNGILFNKHQSTNKKHVLQLQMLISNVNLAI